MRNVYTNYIHRINLWFVTLRLPLATSSTFSTVGRGVNLNECTLWYSSTTTNYKLLRKDNKRPTDEANCRNTKAKLGPQSRRKRAYLGLSEVKAK